MADLTYTGKATRRRASQDIVPGKGNANALQVLCSSTIEIAATAADGATYSIGTIPTNARISGLSKVYSDNLGTNGNTLDIGLGSVDGNVTSDPNALNEALDNSGQALAASAVIADIANVGRPAWDFVGGVGSAPLTDPGGLLDVYITNEDGITSITGTVTVEIYGYFD
jgi:hypothetical protein